MSNIIEVSKSCKQNINIQEVEDKLRIGYHFLEKLNKKVGLKLIVSDKNVGEEYPYYEKVQETAQQSHQRTYNTIPGTYFKLGSPLNAIEKVTIPFVYVNINAKGGIDYCSFNIYAHELGHAIWDLCGISTDKKFEDLHTQLFSVIYKNSYTVMKNYLMVVEEFFAETFAMYVEKQLFKDFQYATPLSQIIDGQTQIYDYEKSIPIEKGSHPWLNQSPHDVLKTIAKEINDYFDTLFLDL